MEAVYFFEAMVNFYWTMQHQKTVYLYSVTFIVGTGLPFDYFGRYMSIQIETSHTAVNKPYRTDILVHVPYNSQVQFQAKKQNTH